AQSDSTTKKLSNKELKKNHFLLEGAGNTLFYMLGFERNFNLSDASRFSLTLGGTYIPANKQHVAFNYYTIGGTYHIRRDFLLSKAHSKKKVKRNDKVGFFETGIFYINQQPDLRESRPWINWYLGYNLYPSESSWFFRFGTVINILRPEVEREIKELPFSPIPLPRFVLGYSF
ncbi:MAG: hypothetical protein SNJ77_04065, partial [Cytophagales bacterium]